MIYVAPPFNGGDMDAGNTCLPAGRNADATMLSPSLAKRGEGRFYKS